MPLHPRLLAATCAVLCAGCADEANVLGPRDRASGAVRTEESPDPVEGPTCAFFNDFATPWPTFAARINHSGPVVGAVEDLAGPQEMRSEVKFWGTAGMMVSGEYHTVGPIRTGNSTGSIYTRHKYFSLLGGWMTGKVCIAPGGYLLSSSPADAALDIVSTTPTTRGHPMRSLLTRSLPVAVATAVASAQVPTVRTQHSFSFHLGRESPAPGFRFAPAIPPNRGVYVAERAIVSDADFEDASTVPARDGLQLNVRFTEAATARMATATQGHVGELGVVLVNGRVAQASPIVDPNGLTTGILFISLRLPAKDAGDIAAAVAARWPKKRPQMGPRATGTAPPPFTDVRRR